MTKRTQKDIATSPVAATALKLNVSFRSNGASYKSTSSTDGQSPMKQSRKSNSQGSKVHGFIAKANEDKVFKRARELVTTQNQKDTFYIMNIDEVAKRIALWNKYMPAVKIYYAVKSNNNKHLLKFMVDNGSNFDCASVSEIESILALGASPDRIIFANS